MGIRSNRYQPTGATMLDKQANKIPAEEAVSQQPAEQTESARRRVLTSAISASALIVTAANKPAWAGDTCSRSALNSANLSGKNTFPGCGKSAGFWKEHLDKWPSECLPNLLFTSVFGSCKYLTGRDTILFNARTLGQVITDTGAGESNPSNIGLHVVGAYANSYAFPKSNPTGKGFVYSPTEVISLLQKAASDSRSLNSLAPFETLKETLWNANNQYDGNTSWK